MSFFTPEGEETCSEAASRVFDALLEQRAATRAGRRRLVEAQVEAARAGGSSREHGGQVGDRHQGPPEQGAAHRAEDQPEDVHRPDGGPGGGAEPPGG